MNSLAKLTPADPGRFTLRILRLTDCLQAVADWDVKKFFAIFSKLELLDFVDASLINAFKFSLCFLDLYQQSEEERNLKLVIGRGLWREGNVNLQPVMVGKFNPSIFRWEIGCRPKKINIWKGKAHVVIC